MGEASTIEWTDATWPVVKGCDYVSPGCANCYAATLIHRHSRNPNPKISLPLAGLTNERGRWTGKVYLNEPHLADPLKWKRGRMIFVPSHGDLFHADVPDEFIDRVFAVMALTQRHTFQVLTKRSERMAAYMGRLAKSIAPLEAAARGMGWTFRFVTLEGREASVLPWPIPNVWLGVSVENQATADARIPHLLATPAAVRFLSCEPLLGPVDLRACRYKSTTSKCWSSSALSGTLAGGQRVHLIDWVIVGGESGPGARPCRVEWVRSLVGQCRAAAVPCFAKQLGENVVDRNDHFGGSPDFPGHWPDDLDPMRVEHDIHGFREEYQGADCRVRLIDRKGGDPLEWPADLRVRQFPTTAPTAKGLAP